MRKIEFPKAALKIIARLTRGNYHSAYFVGGCVRDYLRGVPPHDYDIATDATPDDVHWIMDESGHMRCPGVTQFIVYDTGVKHGTVTVCHGDEAYEVTTYRTDGNYGDGRHPDTVTFASTIEEDLSRRDFTINAMALDAQGDTLVDPYGGRVDLENGIIRCVGNPFERFTEDALRILRALRFAAVLGFAIEEKTSEAMHTLRGRLALISRERIHDELHKMFQGNSARIQGLLLEYADIFTTVIPELTPMLAYDQQNDHHDFDLWEHTARAVGAMDVVGDRIVRRMRPERSRGLFGLTLLLHDTGKPTCRTFDGTQAHYGGHGKVSREIADRVTESLRCDNEARDAIGKLVLFHDAELGKTESNTRRWLNRIGPELLTLLICVQVADHLGQKERTPEEVQAYLDDADQRLELLQKVMAEEQAFTMNHLAINGRDLMRAFGIREGKEIGHIKNALLDAVIEGAVENTREALLMKAEELIGNGEEN